MSRVKLKEKGQLTIPASVREQISAHTGDMFEVAVANGSIVLKPLDVVARKSASTPKREGGFDISKWIGAGKGLFQSPEDAADFIARERASWD